MDREFYLDLAASGLRMIIGTDLVLHEHPDAHSITLDGQRMGQVVQETAHRFKTPLAILQMDLMLEKADLLNLIGLPPAQVDSYHFAACPSDAQLDLLQSHLNAPFLPRMNANLQALRYINNRTSLVPVAMCIGPFSLATKLMSDPITPVYMAGAGATAADDEEVKIFERVLEMSLQVVLRSISAQLRAGAKAVFIAEPAANKAYISPNQLSAGSDIFDRYVMTPNRRIKALLDDHHADLLFHGCGELVDDMLRKLVTLDMALLSLGSSRRLWEDTRIVPPTTVLFGNLPTKKFYSDDVITVRQVEAMTRELLVRMKTTGHPFILASECDVLSVPGCERTIHDKVDAMLHCKVGFDNKPIPRWSHSQGKAGRQLLPAKGALV